MAHGTLAVSLRQGIYLRADPPHIAAIATREPESHLRPAQELVVPRREGLLAFHPQRRNPRAVVLMDDEGNVDEASEGSVVGHRNDLDCHVACRRLSPCYRTAIAVLLGRAPRTPSSCPTVVMIEMARSICASVCAELMLERMSERLAGVAGGRARLT